MSKLAIIFAALFAVSEALALIPSVKGNSIFTRANGLLHGLKEMLLGKQLGDGK